MLLKMKKFKALSKEEKKLFLEAYASLAMTRTAILTMPFKRLTRTLEHTTQAALLTEIDDAQMKTAKRVGEAIGRASAYTPWESACLAQSLTAQKMLQKRGIPGVFYLGVMKDNGIKAHAWSQCGDAIITGESGYEAFKVLSIFAWKV